MIEAVFTPVALQTPSVAYNETADAIIQSLPDEPSSSPSSSIQFNHGSILSALEIVLNDPQSPQLPDHQQSHAELKQILSAPATPHPEQISAATVEFLGL